MTTYQSKVFLSFQQGFKAGYSGLGGIYSVDPADASVRLEFPYSAVNAWWLRYGSGGDFPGVSAIGGAWGYLADSTGLYFGGYGIDDNHAYTLNMTNHTVSFLSSGTKEIWSMARMGQVFYASTSFDLMSSTDMKSWSAVPGTHRNMAQDENPIWGMTTLDGKLYAVSNYLYVVDDSGGRNVFTPPTSKGEVLKAVTVWNGKIWFSGFANDVNSKSTWLYEYDPSSGNVTTFDIPLNAVTDMLVYDGNLWMTGFTGPRTTTCGCTTDSGNLHGNVGVLLKFDGKKTTMESQVKGSQGLLGIAAYGNYLYFGTYTGDIYRRLVNR